MSMIPRAAASDEQEYAEEYIFAMRVLNTPVYLLKCFCAVDKLEVKVGTAKHREGQCTYAYRDGKRCTSEIEGRGQFCFWHDPAANKESPDIKDRLQEWARSHRYL